MLIFPKEPAEHYYEVINSPGPSVLLFGEDSEHWTSTTVDLLQRSNIPVYFYRWSKVEALRLQLNLLRYPVVQLWAHGEMVAEGLGFHEETLEDLMKKFFKH